VAHILVDILLLAILGFTVWQGHRKGFILTLAGILVLVVSLWGATSFSGHYADDFEERLVPLVGWAAAEATEAAIREGNYTLDASKESALRIAADAFSRMGIIPEEAEKLADSTMTDILENDLPLKAGITNTFINTMCRALLFIFAFTVLALLLTLVAHFVSMLFKIPGFRLIDTIGGLAAGLVYGLLLLSAIGWCLRFLGMIAPADFIESTVLLRFFVNNNLLAAVL